MSGETAAPALLEVAIMRVNLPMSGAHLVQVIAHTVLHTLQNMALSIRAPPLSTVERTF